MPAQSKRARKKDAIVEIATKLFYERSYFGTSMDDIATACALNKGTLYYYFSSKSDILYCLFMETINFGLQRVSPSLGEHNGLNGVRRMIQSMVEAVAAKRLSIAAMYQELHIMAYALDAEQLAEVRNSQRAYERLCTEILRRANDEGSIEIKDYRLVYHSLIGMIAWTHRWTKPDEDIAHVAEGICDQFLNGVRPA